MRTVLILGALTALSTSCTTLDQSLQLGAATGALAGAASTYASERASGRDPKFGDVGLGATMGLGLGLLTSYFVHQSIMEKREYDHTTDMYFGDLPPSPFVIPQTKKKGGR